jgi:uncharacterized protein
MPEGTVSFEVRATPERVWAFLSDMREVGRCVPGVEGVEVLDDRRARWSLRVKVGPVAQTMQITTETLEQVPLRHGKFRGEAELLEIIGTIDLAPAGHRTKVVYTMTVTAKGPLARIMENIIRSQLQAQTEEFALNVRRALER